MIDPKGFDEGSSSPVGRCLSWKYEGRLILILGVMSFTLRGDPQKALEDEKEGVKTKES